MKANGAIVFLAVALQTAVVTAQNRSLDIYWVDSEGGGSTLIVTPEKESILIDAGNPGVRDPGRIAKVAREVAKLEKINYLVVTHFHSDHFGGAPELAALIPIENVYDNGIPEKNPDGYPDTSWPLKIRPYREMKVSSRHVVEPGSMLPLKSGTGLKISLQFVAARQKFMQSVASTSNTNCQTTVAEKPKDNSDNANSVAVVLRYGKFDYFNAGDMTWNVERELVCPVNPVGKVDLFQSSHHGLDQSNHPLLVHSLAPAVVVFNNGPRKGAEKQSVETARLIPNLEAIFQVHKNIRNADLNTADEHIANVEERCQGNYLKLSVAADGNSYTVEVPHTKFSKKFQSR